MKRKILSLILTLMLVATVCPVSAAATGPFTLEVPQNLTAALKYDVNSVPYFELKLDVPDSIRQIAGNISQDQNYYAGAFCNDIVVEFEYKFGKYGWNEGPSIYWDTSAYVKDLLADGYYKYSPFDSGDINTVDIKSEVYQFRARFFCLWGEPDGWVDNELYSDYSNIATIGNPSFYKDASDWAVPELEKADELGLIPDILKDADLTKPITREEFCELAVLVYERVTGNVSEPVSPNPFKDVTNSQILKAYKLGITAGTSDTTFSPKVLINREQCAAMLFRTIKAMKPDGDFNTAGVKDFRDQNYISSYAVQAVKYMSKIGIITGNPEGNFMPRATTTTQEATGYGMATREQAIAMTLRTFNKMPSVS